MALRLFIHPLASFCHKVLIALHENGTPFTAVNVDLADENDRASILDMWPVGKIPVLRDDKRGQTIAETSIIIEYLDAYYPSSHPLIPPRMEDSLDARLWDRFFDLYVHAPMQKIVTDRIRPEQAHDPHGVAEARATLATAYDMLDQRMVNRAWAIGEAFSMADCAAAPALFYGGIVEPFAAGRPHLSAYFERLVGRPSVAGAIEGARPYFHMFPFETMIPDRFRQPGHSLA
jgi:glutathione S-transferase